MDSAAKPPKRTGITVFSGGTGGNSLVDVFNGIIERRKCRLNYVVPISDNGGSSSELIRFVGGPSVGDIRSRLVRLIPNHEGDEERAALKTLFEYRLSPDRAKARVEWLDIVEGRHLLWAFVSSPKRELIRSVLNTLNLEIVKKARPSSVFNFGGASVGNMFLTGARLFSGSFESAIYLLSMVCAIPSNVSVLPAINSNFTHHISAGLVDGTQIAGQVAVSHPSAETALPDEVLTGTGPASRRGGAESAPVSALGDDGDNDDDDDDDENDSRLHDRIEDANLPGSLPALRRRHVGFSKDEDDEEDLPARIERLWYINPYGHEIWPVANPKVLEALEASDTVVYSVGSLYTSIVPSLVLRGVGRAIAHPAVRRRILILNSRLDRETGPRSDPMTAADFVVAIAKAADRVGATSTATSAAATDNMAGRLDPRRYVTHLFYLDGEATPAVDERALRGMGIECVRMRGRRGTGSETAPRYDEAELGRALETIIAS